MAALQFQIRALPRAHGRLDIVGIGPKTDISHPLRPTNFLKKAFAPRSDRKYGPAIVVRGMTGPCIGPPMGDGAARTEDINSS
jgi:hypothetical protein